MAEKKKEQQDNLRFYEQLRRVPDEALTVIAAGRLKGKSDINPVWRIKALTEAFGPCGIGWKYEITKQWQEVYGQEVKAFTNINLYVKIGDAWSEPIPGTGGATLVELGKSGVYVNDEGFKMSLTDALSVSMKALGVAADVYFAADANKSVYDTKYDLQSYMAQQYQTQAASQPQPTVKQAVQQKQVVGEAQYKGEIAACATMDALMAIWNKYPQLQGDKGFRDAWASRRGQIEKK